MKQGRFHSAMFHFGLFFKSLHDLSDSTVYFLLGLSAFIENIFPPIPGDTVTVFGAFLVGTGRLNFIGVYLSITLGSLLGFMTLFMAGAYLGRDHFIKRDHNFFRKEAIIKAEDWFRRYGYFIILLNRFLPGIRSVISISGGVSGLNRRSVTVLALISCASWNLIWILFGYMLGNNWEEAKDILSVLFLRYNISVTILFLVLILIFIIRNHYHKAKRKG